MTAISINRQRIFIFIFWQRVKGSTWCTSSRWPGCWRQRCSSHSNCFVYLPWRSEPPPAGFVSCLKTSCAADVVIEAGRKLRTNPQWRGSKDVSLSQDLSLGTNNPGQEQFQPRGVWGKRCVCVWGGVMSNDTCASVWAKPCVGEYMLSLWRVLSEALDKHSARIGKLIFSQIAVTLHIFWASV